jgi:glycerophosphoryl diester phosphodiesterase
MTLPDTPTAARPVPTRVELIGHRGASGERPQNTLAAFRRAEELGADAVELDVHLTKDGHLVVLHDRTVPAKPEQLRVDSLTLDELRAFRPEGEPIPTLSEVLAAVKPTTRIYCELKGLRTAGPALELLKSRGEAAAVHSFDHRMIDEARAIAPAVARGVLESAYHTDPTASLREHGARDLWQDEGWIDRDMVNRVHAAGGRVIAWTVNWPRRAKLLADIGVDGICTNYVAEVAKALGR